MRGSILGQLVPRSKVSSASDDELARRRLWLEQKTGTPLEHVGSGTLEAASLAGNIENPIGVAQVPLAVAGPLDVNGEYAKGTFYVPLATTEGALVRSYERGMVALSRAGGATARILRDENRVSPVFCFEDLERAHVFATRLPDQLAALQREAESTTSHGKLLRIECRSLGREVAVNFCYSTGDAQGMNMIVAATRKASQWILDHTEATRYYIFSGLSSEKRASGFLFPGGKGKTVVAGANLSAALTKTYLHATPEEMVTLWQHTVLGHIQANAVGYNAHYANGLAALFIACGQDVANVVNASVGVTNFELTDEGSLYASVTLPSLTVATVGGGTALGTARECLKLLGCQGSGQATKFAEIVAATLLAGELSMGAAITAGEFVAAHERYGRNRPAVT